MGRIIYSHSFSHGISMPMTYMAGSRLPHGGTKPVTPRAYIVVIGFTISLRNLGTLEYLQWSMYPVRGHIAHLSARFLSGNDAQGGISPSRREADNCQPNLVLVRLCFACKDFPLILRNSRNIAVINFLILPACGV